MYLNSSRAQLFQDCKRKFYFSQLYHGTGLAPDKEDTRLVTGISVHVGMAALYLKKGVELAAKAAKDTYLAARMKWNSFILDEWKEEADYCQLMIEQYDKRKSPHDDFEVVDVEQSFAVPLGEVCYNCGHPYESIDIEHQECLTCEEASINFWVGTRDVLVKRGGHDAVLDHKTTSSTPDDSFLERFRRSFQLLGYVYGSEKSIGRKIRTYGVNALQKAKSLGKDKSTLKRCPDCHAGKNKMLSCETCNRTGKVEKKIPLVPFRRKWFTLMDADIDRFVLWAYKIMRDIRKETELMEEEPEIAFEMNSNKCSFCPFPPLCWQQQDATRWYEPTEEQINEAEVHPRPKDYVRSFEEAAKEEEI